jgi:hypothetical protein
MKLSQNRTIRYSAGLIMLTALTTILTGCSSYRLGSSLPPGINVINIPTFVNKTSEPLLEVVTTAATISEIQRDGTLSLGDLNKSDVVLYVSLIELHLNPLRYESETTTTTREYRLIIKASLRLENRVSGKVMLRNVVTGEWDFMPTGDLSSAKRDALPPAAQDLAHSIVEKVVEYW